MSRHKEQVTLYASERDLASPPLRGKTKEKLYHSLGKAEDKLSTLDFTDAREPTPTPHMPSQEKLDQHMSSELEKTKPHDTVQSLRHVFMQKVHV